MKQPTEFASRIIQIFHVPSACSVSGGAHGREDERGATPEDQEAVELFARAREEYRGGKYQRALATLEALAHLAAEGRAHPGDVARSRIEVLAVMGRADEATTELRSYLRKYSSAAQQLARCWLWGLLLERGDADGALAVQHDLEAPALSESAVGAISILQFAWFAAFIGELDMAERQLGRWLDLPADLKRGTQLEGFAKTAAYLAQEGGSSNAQTWAAGLIDRLRANRTNQ